jgi:hypothetical protein
VSYLIVNPGSDHLAGDARGIIQRCHEGQGVIWRTLHTSEGSVVPTGLWKWFLSSGREYPTDSRRVAVSSTKIREVLQMTTKEGMYDRLKVLALNPRLLLQILGLGND